MPWDKKGSEYTPVSAEEWLKRAREYRDKVDKERREMMAKYPGRTHHTYPMGSTQETARAMAFQDWFRPKKGRVDRSDYSEALRLSRLLKGG